MNERITKLAYTAKEYATTRHPVSKIVLNVDPYVFEQKFAESLVRECIAKVSEWDMGIDDPVGATDNTSVVSRDIVAEIKQHFGVE